MHCPSSYNAANIATLGALFFGDIFLIPFAVAVTFLLFILDLLVAVAEKGDDDDNDKATFDDECRLGVRV